jgi:hypothetical protein
VMTVSRKASLHWRFAGEDYKTSLSLKMIFARGKCLQLRQHQAFARLFHFSDTMREQENSVERRLPGVRKRGVLERLLKYFNLMEKGELAGGKTLAVEIVKSLPFVLANNPLQISLACYSSIDTSPSHRVHLEHRKLSLGSILQSEILAIPSARVRINR